MRKLRRGKMGKKDDGLPLPEDLDFGDNLPEMSEEEEQELFKWMMGMESEPPDVVRRIASNLAEKINIFSGYIITRNLKRINDIINFMESAEDYLFDVEELIENDEIERMYQYYQSAGVQLNNTLEWMRKYVYQNKEDLKEAGQKTNKVQQLLLSLPADKLDELIEALEKGDYDRIVSDKEED